LLIWCIYLGVKISLQIMGRLLHAAVVLGQEWHIDELVNARILLIWAVGSMEFTITVFLAGF
jgi:hypothetical protein